MTSFNAFDLFGHLGSAKPSVDDIFSSCNLCGACPSDGPVPFSLQCSKSSDTCSSSFDSHFHRNRFFSFHSEHISRDVVVRYACGDFDDPIYIVVEPDVNSILPAPLAIFVVSYARRFNYICDCHVNSYFSTLCYPNGSSVLYSVYHTGFYSEQMIDTIMSTFYIKNSIYGESSIGITFRDLSTGDKFHLLYDSDRNYLYKIDDKYFSEWNKRVVFRIVVHGVKYHVFGEKSRSHVYCFLRQLNPVRIGLSGESLFSSIDIFGFGTIISDLFTCLKNSWKIYNSPGYRPLIIDVCSLFVQFLDPTMVTLPGVISLLMRFYSIYVRGCDIVKGESMDILMSIAAAMLLPPELMSLLKTISLLTGKKVLDTPNLILDLVSHISKYLLICFDLIPNTPDFLRKWVHQLCSLGSRRLLMDKMSFYLEQWNRNKRLVQQDEWRDEVTKFSVSLFADENLIDYTRQSTFASSRLSDFKRLLKSLRAYEACSRREPVCFVFEGPPGCRKSIHMTQLAQSMGRSKYVHTTKSIEDGKDFYDSYNNEELFIMDDLGQMGVSQWRNIINMVSMVKLPLDCAAADLKDTKFFDSDYIFVSTNHFQDIVNSLTRKDCISDVKALWRRCHVFNYNSVVISDNGELISGVVKYRRYDVITDNWVSTFPSPKMSTIPSFCDVSDSSALLTWMMAISVGLRAHYNSVHKSVLIDSGKAMEIRVAAYKLLKGVFPDDELDGFDLRPSRPVSNSFSLAIDETFSTPSNIDVSDFKPIVPEMFRLDPSGVCYHSSDVLHRKFGNNGYSFVLDYMRYILSGLCNFVSSIFSKLTEKTVMIASMGTAFAGIVYYLYSKFLSPLFVESTFVSIRDKWSNVMSNRPSCQLTIRGEGKMDSSVPGVPTLVEAVNKRMVVVEFPKFNGDVSGASLAQGLLSGHHLIVVGHVAEGHSGVVNVFSSWDSYASRDFMLNNIPFSVCLDEVAADTMVLQLPREMISPFKKCSQFFRMTKGNHAVSPYLVNAGDRKSVV